MEIRVSATRMEMNRLKKRLQMARRGHKLLKDKLDELMRKFVDLVRHNKELREEVEQSLTEALGKFLLARAVMSGENLEEAVMYPKTRVALRVERVNIMSVYAPRFTWSHLAPGQAEDEGESVAAAASAPGGGEAAESQRDIYPYGFSDTSAELDASIATLDRLLPRLLELAEVEKAVHLLAEEIEKTRRRVNALEHILIPQLQEGVRYIVMKLEENERGALTRLMKVKDIVRARSV